MIDRTRVEALHATAEEPFHNMALLSPHHTPTDVDRDTEAFAEAIAALT